MAFSRFRAHLVGLEPTLDHHDRHHHRDPIRAHRRRVRVSLSTAAETLLVSELLRFLIQVIVILTMSHLVGAVLVRWGQPRVIGEILAGILLGPSFLGWLAPAIWVRIFPATSLSLLNIVSQLGLI